MGNQNSNKLDQIKQELQTGHKHELLREILDNQNFRKSSNLIKCFEKLLEDGNLLENETLTILFTGKSNSGKTTVLNSLIFKDGSEYLFPTSDLPETNQIFALRNNYELEGRYRIRQIGLTPGGKFNFTGQSEKDFTSDKLELIQEKIKEYNSDFGDPKIYLVETALKMFGTSDIVFIDVPGHSVSKDHSNQQFIKTDGLLLQINHNIHIDLIPSDQVFLDNQKQGKQEEKKQVEKIYTLEPRKILLISKIHTIDKLKQIEMKNQNLPKNELKNQIKQHLDNKIDFIKQQFGFKYDNYWFYCSKIDEDFLGFPNTSEIVQEQNNQLFSLVNYEYQLKFDKQNREKQFIELLKLVKQSIEQNTKEIDSNAKNTIQKSIETLKNNLRIAIQKFKEKNKNLKPNMAEMNSILNELNEELTKLFKLELVKLEDVLKILHDLNCQIIEDKRENDTINLLLKSLISGVSIGLLVGAIRVIALEATAVVTSSLFLGPVALAVGVGFGIFSIGMIGYNAIFNKLDLVADQCLKNFNSKADKINEAFQKSINDYQIIRQQK